MTIPVQVVAAIITRKTDEGTEVLICQRTAEETFPLQWEFPGGKVEPGESLPKALLRELDEELGIVADVGRRLAVVRHTYPSGRNVELHFFRVESFAGAIQNRIFAQVTWAPLDTLFEYSFLAADHALLRELAEGKLL